MADFDRRKEERREDEIVRKSFFAVVFRCTGLS